MKHWRFYIRHALRDMLRNRQRTLFALFCVMAGVAAVVSMGMLGVMIEDGLTQNIAALNQGDIRAWPNYRASTETEDGRRVFRQSTVNSITEWAAERDIEMTTAVDNVNLLLAPIRDGEPGLPQNVQLFFVDPAVYPFYSEITMLTPAGQSLRDSLQGVYDIVVSENLATRQGLEVGEQVRLSLVEEYFTVRGIVPTEAENVFQGGPETFLFGYAYLTLDQMAMFDLETMPNQMYFKLPADADVAATDRSLYSRFNIRTRTRDELLEMNEFLADFIGDFVLIMGLAALVVGGVGIINTMLVIVGRRTVEIAVLKTIGLKGRQITLLFLVEAVILGFLGSLIGIVVGLLLSLIAQYFGEQFLQQSLRWRIALEPLIVGVGMGVTVTAIFGFLPTLTAARVRPAVVLRPADALLPRAGIVRRLVSLVVLTVVLGLLVNVIIGDWAAWYVGFILAAIGMVILGVLLGLFWVIVWLIGRLPAFGWVDLKLAIRAITTRRSRTASSLLALTAGVFALSVITLMSTTVVQVLNFSFTDQLGGNILTTSLLPGGNNRIISVVEEMPEVSYLRYGSYEIDLLAINGETPYAAFSAAGLTEDQRDDIDNLFSFVLVRDINGPTPSPRTRITAGRRLDVADADAPVIVLPDNEAIRALGIAPGDTIRLRLRSFSRSTAVVFEVVGLMEQRLQSFDLSAFTGLVIPLEAAAAELPPEFALTMVNAPPQAINETLIALGDVPGVILFELTSFTTAFERLMAQMSAIPLLVAGLALFAATTIIANTVSLATLERRRQIGIMKALGLKGNRVLRLLLLENALIGLVGGLVGVGVSALVIWLVTWLNGGGDLFRQSIAAWQVILLLGMSVAIAVFATLLTAWGASREKPMNVLRYE
jgi:putative ABC transport system permease protein